MTKEIYIRPFTKSSIINKKQVLLKDIAEISAPPSIISQVQDLCILRPTASQKTNYLVSIIDIINLITHSIENVTVNNVGEMDVIIEYFPVAPINNHLIECGKVVIASLIIFAGATVAIMAYQTDTSLSKTFTLINKIFTGNTETSPLYITIPYTLGIPIGTIVFFNHIGKKKLTDDPTPIQIEINKYETDVETTIAEVMTEEKRGKNK